MNIDIKIDTRAKVRALLRVRVKDGQPVETRRVEFDMTPDGPKRISVPDGEIVSAIVNIVRPNEL